MVSTALLIGGGLAALLVVILLVVLVKQMSGDSPNPEPSPSPIPAKDNGEQGSSPSQPQNDQEIATVISGATMNDSDIMMNWTTPGGKFKAGRGDACSGGCNYNTPVCNTGDDNPCSEVITFDLNQQATITDFIFKLKNFSSLHADTKDFKAQVNIGDRVIHIRGTDGNGYMNMNSLGGDSRSFTFRASDYTDDAISVTADSITLKLWFSSTNPSWRMDLGDAQVMTA